MGTGGHRPIVNEPLESLYCREVIARYGDWKDQYVPVPGSLVEEQPEGAWDSDDAWLKVTKLDPHILTRRWLVGRVTPHARNFPDVTEAAALLSAFALVGESGAGKSVVLMRLALQEALTGLRDSRPPRLPFLVRLNRYRPFSIPARFLVRHMQEQGRVGFPAHEQLASTLRDRLENGQMLLLLDGLDELPRKFQTRALKQWRAFIRRYGSEGQGNRIVVTTRHLDLIYPAGLPVVSLRPLADGDRLQLLSIYLGEDIGRSLWAELQRPERQGLLQLAGNPFWLLRIADIFRLEGHLPDNRGRVLATWVACMRTPEAQGEEETFEAPESEPSEADWRPAFGEAALKLSRQYGDSAVIKRSRLRQMLSGSAPKGAFDEQLLTEQSAFLDGEELLLRERHSPDPLLWFKHEWLQAYFSAEALSRRFSAGKHKPSSWQLPPGKDNLRGGRLLRRNAFTPLPGILSRVQQKEVLLLLGLTPDPSELLRTLAKVNPLIAGQCSLEGGVQLDEGIHQEIVDALMAVIADENSGLTLRIGAGDLLGKLGDPRLSETVPVPAGKAALGSGRGCHSVDVSAFHCFKYPVTRGEFAQFVGSDAYNQREWWTRAGWEWCRSTWQAGNRNVSDIIPGRPNHPMTGVTWYEAVAYGNWLSSHKDVLYRLPSEAEWEKAARGPTGHAFPWGDDPAPSHANTCTFDSLYVFDTTPVGIYSEGVGWYGGHDQAGNVWEWCTSRYQPYPYNPHDGREVLQGDEARVLRGGSWLHHLERAKCSARNAELPDVARPDIGFRLIEIAI